MFNSYSYKENIFLILLIFLGFSLYAGENTHVIEEINFIIQGDTQENALRKFVDLKKGDTFPDEETLKENLEQEKQDLVNYRVYDSVEYTSEIIRQDSGTTYWRITYQVVDTWTLIPIPYPKYSSSSGFRLALRTDYKNAFGTMSDINLNMGFNLQYNDNSGSMEVTRWNFTPEWSRIRINDWLRLTFIADMSYSYDRFESGDVLSQYNYSYYRTGLGTSFLFDLPGNWFYRVSPYFDFKYGYDDKNDWGNYSEEPFNIAVSHGGGWGAVNWSQNFREGQSYSLTHKIRYTFSSDVNDRKLVNELDASAKWYALIGDMLNFYTRLGAFYVFNDVRSSAGGYIRGVNNYSMSGQTGVYLNNTLGFQFWRWEGVWDAQIHPFFDIGMIGNPGDFKVNRDFQYGSGVDLVLFLDKLPTLVARATIGFNLSDQSLNGWDKLDLIITSTLSY